MQTNSATQFINVADEISSSRRTYNPANSAAGDTEAIAAKGRLVLINGAVPTVQAQTGAYPSELFSHRNPTYNENTIAVASDRGALEISGTNLMYEGTRVKTWIIGRDVNPGGRGDGDLYSHGAFTAGSLRPIPTTIRARGWGNSVNNSCTGGCGNAFGAPNSPPASGNIQSETEPPDDTIWGSKVLGQALRKCEDKYFSASSNSQNNDGQGQIGPDVDAGPQQALPACTSKSSWDNPGECCSTMQSSSIDSVLGVGGDEDFKDCWSAKCASQKSRCAHCFEDGFKISDRCTRKANSERNKAGAAMALAAFAAAVAILALTIWWALKIAFCMQLGQAIGFANPVVLCCFIMAELLFLSALCAIIIVLQRAVYAWEVRMNDISNWQRDCYRKNCEAVSKCLVSEGCSGLHCSQYKHFAAPDPDPMPDICRWVFDNASNYLSLCTSLPGF